MVYPLENNFSAAEQELIFRIRQLIGDTKEIFIDDKTADFADISINGTMYKLDEPKGYPLQITVGDQEYTTSGTYKATVLGNKYIQFENPVLVSGAEFSVVYNHFRYSDEEILDTYDTSSMTYLTSQCNISQEDLGIDLLVLSTAYIFLTQDLNNYVKSAVKLQDSDSQFDASNRPQYIRDLLRDIATNLKNAIEIKTRCKMLSLPVYKVE